MMSTPDAEIHLGVRPAIKVSHLAIRNPRLTMNSRTCKFSSLPTALARHSASSLTALRWLTTATLSCLLAASATVWGQTWSWMGAGGTVAMPKSGNWSAAGNWAPAGPPNSANNTALVFNDAGRQGRYTSTVDPAGLGAANNPFNLTTLTFGPPPAGQGATGIKIGYPPPFPPAASLHIMKVPVINQNSPGTVFVDVPLSVDLGLQYFPAAGTGMTTLNQPISDGNPFGGVFVIGADSTSGPLVLNSANTFTGPTAVFTSGTLFIVNGALGLGTKGYNGFSPGLTMNATATIGAAFPFREAAGEVSHPVLAGVPVSITGNANYGNPSFIEVPLGNTDPFRYSHIMSTLSFDKGATLSANVTINVLSTSVNSALPITRPGKIVALNQPVVVTYAAGTTADNQLIINGLSGDFNVTLTGGGIFQLRSPNANFGVNAGGNITINSGTLYLNNSALSGSVTVNPAGLIKGTGKIMNAKFGPQNPVPGAVINRGGGIRPGDDPGVLTISNGLEIAGGTLYADLLGPDVVGSPDGYSQLQVNGGTAVTNGILAISLDYTPGVNDVFFLIDNQDSTPFAGSFTNTYGIYDPIAGVTNTFIDVVNHLTGQIFTFQVSTTGDAENENPDSLTGNDLVLYNAQATPNVATFPPANAGIYPQADGSIQISAGSFPGQTYVLQATPQLAPLAWTAIATNTADMNGACDFTDSNSANYLMQFYRIVSGN